MSAIKAFMQFLSVMIFALYAALASAQAPSYGAQVTIDQAKKIAAGAIAEAQKNGLRAAVAIVDTHGYLVYFEKMDDTQIASVQIAIEKAKASAVYRRPTRAFQEGVAKGGVALLALPGATPFSGGVPIVDGGKISGAVGVSGGTPDQDEQCAKAGLAAM